MLQAWILKPHESFLCQSEIFSHFLSFLGKFTKLLHFFSWFVGKEGAQVSSLVEMQEIHRMGGGRFFSGGGGDRRMKPHHHHNHLALKCPRCDSPNTKFCYYNNYNLSQPRHFCKNCRRYWTKGGVLRNVPVGGGCRKSKRSKPKNSETTENTICASPPTTTTSDAPVPPPAAAQQELKSNSHSSSESSSLTAANAASSAATTEAISAPTQNMDTNRLLTMHESKFLVNSHSRFANLETGLLQQAVESGIFSEIGSFTSLMTSTSEALPFEFVNTADTSQFRFHQQGSEHLVQITEQPYHHQNNTGSKLPEITGGPMLDQPIQFDLPDLQNKTPNTDGVFGSLDWHGVADQGLFDLPHNAAMDQTYWTQNHWAEYDHTNLYLP